MSAHHEPALYQSLLSGLEPLGEPEAPWKDWPSQPMSPFAAGMGAVVVVLSPGSGSHAATSPTPRARAATSASWRIVRVRWTGWDRVFGARCMVAPGVVGGGWTGCWRA